ncbi:MAG TPA: hypothetical protein VG672_00610, partial [Bryobacteraceae bacterium]|nr:hypothetical protein [Bryobacteraceae bacterium]
MRLPLCVLAGMLLSASVAAPATMFYVAANGSDANPGTESRPFATLERARDAVRAAKGSASFSGGAVTVWVRAGTYPLSRTFQLTAADSGTPQAPVAYRAYRGEAAHLSGGRRISSFAPVTDASIRARLHPLYRDKILAADLRAQRITDFGRLVPRGFGLSAPAALELFCNGRPMPLARWPNEGFVKIAGLPAGEAAKIK